MKQIAILSDTHGLLREHVITELTAADCIIHAGDIDTPYIVESMQRYAETYVVRGNNDKEWAETIPKTLALSIEGVRFFMCITSKMSQIPYLMWMWWSMGTPTNTPRKSLTACCSLIPEAVGSGAFIWRSPCVA